MTARAVKSAPRTFMRPTIKSTITPLLLFLLLFAFGCAKKSNISYRNYRPITLTNPYIANEKRVTNILKTAFSQVGVPYRYGGTSPETGFDCSGFVNWVYKQYGVSLPRSSRDMLTVGEPIAKEDLRPGDLVFFNFGYSHVGIYTGDDKYIHSPRTGKTITESDLNGLGRKDRFVAARRIIDNQGVSVISERLKTEWVAQARSQANFALNEKAQKRSQTLASASSKPARANAAVTAKKIKVVSGDTLVGLAKKYGVATADLVAANRLANKHKLKLGQVLLIPVKAKVAPAVAKGRATEKVEKTAKSSSQKAKKNQLATKSKAKKTTTAKSNRKAKAKQVAKSSQASKNLSAKNGVAKKTTAKSAAKKSKAAAKGKTKKTVASAKSTKAKSTKAENAPKAATPTKAKAKAAAKTQAKASTGSLNGQSTVKR